LFEQQVLGLCLLVSSIVMLLDNVQSKLFYAVICIQSCCQT